MRLSFARSPLATTQSHSGASSRFIAVRLLRAAAAKTWTGCLLCAKAIHERRFSRGGRNRPLRSCMGFVPSNPGDVKVAATGWRRAFEFGQSWQCRRHGRRGREAAQANAGATSFINPVQSCLRRVSGSAGLKWMIISSTPSFAYGSRASTNSRCRETVTQTPE